MLPPDSGERLFLENLETIEEVISFACARTGLRDADAEDFASHVHVRLIENDYAILRKFEGRASFVTFISIVLRRMLLDYRIHLWGKWHSSAEAKRLGPVAVELETILHRDDRTIADALPLCRKLDPSVTLESLEALAARMPKRAPRPRAVSLDAATAELHLPPETADGTTTESERKEASEKANAVLRATVSELPKEDQDLLRLHFNAALSIVQVGRILNTDHKPLYRRLRRITRELRRALESAGVTAAIANELVGTPDIELDFGLEQETSPPRPSLSIDGNPRDRGESS